MCYCFNNVVIAVTMLFSSCVEILQRHCEDNEGKDGMKPYLAIPHVRDMLIAPADRSVHQGALFVIVP